MGRTVDFNNLVSVNTGKKNLGSGAYASVRLVKDRTTGEKYALKEVRIRLKAKERYSTKGVLSWLFL